MRRYLLERYVPGLQPGDLAREVAQLDDALAQLDGDGKNLRRIRSILVPDDETCFHYVEATAGGVDVLRALVARRGDRLSEAVE